MRLISYDATGATPTFQSIIRLASCWPSMSTTFGSTVETYWTASDENVPVVMKIPFFARLPCRAPTNF